jgi:GT2 family glycosyltransferase
MATRDPQEVVHEVASLEAYVDRLLAEEGLTFEQWAGRYGRDFYRVRNELVSDMLAAARPRQVLEFACAGGFLARLLLERLPSIDAYTCTNFSSRMSAYCAEQLAAFPVCRVKVLDADVLRSSDLAEELRRGYDTVITTSLEHIQFDVELVRALPAGTRFIFSVASFDDPEHFRWFTDEEAIRGRYGDLLDLQDVRAIPEGLKWVVSSIRRDVPAHPGSASPLPAGRREVGARARGVAVSIIVPCRNGGRHVGALMSSLAAQRFLEQSEIVFVNNRCTDESCDVVTHANVPIAVRVVDAPDRANASYARNVGVAAAAGHKLLFLDADDEVEPGYVAAMGGALDVHEFVTSRVDVEALNASWVRGCHGTPWQRSGVERYFDFLPAAGPNVGICRALYEKVGGYPEEFPFSQDIAFSWRAQLAGASLHFVEAAVYRYRFRTTLRALFQQSRNWGASNALLFRTFRASGMPARALRQAARDWEAALAACARARDRAEAARSIVQLGMCIGRFEGSLRHGVLYF